MPNMVSWVRAFRRAAREEPRYWGLHNYIDANRARTTGTRRMLRAVKGQVWFTETGGIVARRNRHKVTFPESAKHAATATRFLFDKLVPLSRRVTRVYIYHWNADAPAATWDSALDRPDRARAARLQGRRAGVLHEAGAPPRRARRARASAARPRPAPSARAPG